MRKYSILFFISLVIVFVSSSCGNKSKKTDNDKEFIRPAAMDFTSKDSAEIKSLLNTFVGYINQGDISNASSMLYFVHNDSVTPLPLEKRQKFEFLLTKFPFKSAELKSYKLMSKRDNTITIALKMTDNADVESGKNTINLAVNPVVKNGTWYLTLRDNDAEGVDNPEIIR